MTNGAMTSQAPNRMFIWTMCLRRSIRTSVPLNQMARPVRINALVLRRGRPLSRVDVITVRQDAPEICLKADNGPDRWVEKRVLGSN